MRSLENADVCTVQNILLRRKIGSALNFFVQTNSFCIFILRTNRSHCASQFFKFRYARQR